ncbi:MAG TPA: POTRA domain-containing protein [Thermoanaerobaculia bacterium]
MRRFPLLATVAGLFALTVRLMGQVPESTLPALYGREIVSVFYTSDGPVDASRIADLVELAVGKPLTEEATGDTIRNLFATRRFADVQIEAEPVESGVSVIVHLFRAYQVKPLKFTGRLPLAREELRRALSFGEGSLFQQSEVDDGIGALQRRLEQEGFLQARVTARVTLDPATFDASVVYLLDPGPRARVARIFFDGDTKPFTPDELARHGKLKLRNNYSESKARAGASKITQWLHKNSWLRASVDLIAAQPTDDGGIMPVYRVTIGKKVLFETKGVKASRVLGEIRDLIEGQDFDEDLILEYVQNKREALQNKGHYKAKVDYRITEQPDTTTVTITVDDGPHFEIEQVDFTGNGSVSSKKLLSLMVTHRRTFPLIAPGHLVDRELDDDVSAIRGYYQTNGWVSVKIERPRIEEGSKTNRLVVTIPIEEGPRAIVASRKIEGAAHAEEGELQKILKVKVGEPFNPDQARLDAYNLAAYYHDHGWRETSVKQEFTLTPDRTAADLIYRVEEGMRSFFGKTIVRGNTRTRTSKLMQLTTWKEGEPYSETKVVDTQRNLARAGVFRRIEIKPGPANPATEASNVEIEVQEGRPLSLLYGVGYQYAPDADQNRSDPYLLGGVSYNNLFGKMLYAGLEGQLAISGR